ncbi:MAG: inositol monophosphatase family protein [Acidobacteriota bacterium]
MTPIEIATEAAHAGATVLLDHWENLTREDALLKGRNDWVSRADRESELAIIAAIRNHCPDDSFLGEEGGTIHSVNPGSPRTWVIDPLDGTSNYLQHFPFWSISIALREGEETVAGLVYEPLRSQFFSAELGAGAFRNGLPMRVSGHDGLDGSFLATGFPFRAQKQVHTYVRIFEEVIRQAKGVRRAGSAALDLAYTAAGVFDGFFELHLAPWDVAAGALLVREAGGVVSDFSGGDLFWEQGNIVGATPGIHAELMKVVNRYTNEANLSR